MADDFRIITSGKCCHGGWKCRYCGPKPSEKPKIRRLARRSLKASDAMHVRYDLSLEYIHPAEERAYREADLRGIA